MNRKDVVQLTEDLQHAVNLLQKDKVIDLLAKGAKPSLIVNNTTALHLIVKKPKNAADEQKALTILELLLDAEGCDVNQQVDKRTVINLAGHNLFLQAVKLIATKKSTDEKDSAHFSSALLDVVRFCEDRVFMQDLVALLLGKGAVPNWLNKHDGFNALHWAVIRGEPFVIRLILNQYPDAYLNQSIPKKIDTPLREKSRTPARLAMRLLLEYEQKSHLTAEEMKAKKLLWECIVAIAEIAYLPIIQRKKADYPKQLEDEKRIIFRYVCSLPIDEKWDAIVNGQDEKHPLGALNATHREGGSGETNTIGAYREEQVRMLQQGYKPRIPRTATPPRNILKTSPQLFQSAPRVITDYISEPQKTSEAPAIKEYSPVFHFCPTQSLSIPIKKPTGEEKHSPRSRSPSPAPSPQEVLEDLFGHSPAHQSTDDSPLKGPSRFSHT